MWSLRPASSLSHRLSPNREEAAPTNALGAQSLANTSRKHAQFSKEWAMSMAATRDENGGISRKP